MEVGTGNSLFSNKFETFVLCATDTWVKHTWNFMSTNNIVIEEGTPNLKKQRENDKFLMEKFATAGYSGDELAMLNRCKIYLEILTTADMTTGDVRKILLSVLKGMKPLSEHPLKWAPQSKPPAQAWKKWDHALRTTFQLQGGNLLPEHLRL
eukprot:14466551-Ditylum_brightwellii.AAC.1